MHSVRSHTPSERRRLSDLGHRVEGALLLAVAALALLAAAGVGWAAVAWPILLLVAGLALLALVYALHPRRDWGRLSQRVAVRGRRA